MFVKTCRVNRWLVQSFGEILNNFYQIDKDVTYVTSILEKMEKYVVESFHGVVCKVQPCLSAISRNRQFFAFLS